MNTKTKLALAAVLFSAVASPAFASDQDLASVTENSGRIIVQPIAVPANAYASAKWTHHRAPARWSVGMSMTDFQAVGGHN